VTFVNGARIAETTFWLLFVENIASTERRRNRETQGGRKNGTIFCTP